LNYSSEEDGSDRDNDGSDRDNDGSDENNQDSDDDNEEWPQNNFNRRLNADHPSTFTTLAPAWIAIVGPHEENTKNNKLISLHTFFL